MSAHERRQDWWLQSRCGDGPRWDPHIYRVKGCPWACSAALLASSADQYCAAEAPSTAPQSRAHQLLCRSPCRALTQLPTALHRNVRNAGVRGRGCPAGATCGCRPGGAHRVHGAVPSPARAGAQPGQVTGQLPGPGDGSLAKPAHPPVQGRAAVAAKGPSGGWLHYTPGTGRSLGSSRGRECG